jgi:formylglycine-generating enzyme required for sulfatase activity
MILDANYRQRRGYRLPTMAEWELAVRAGTRTDRYFGTDVSRADNYAWHQSNTHGSAQPVGQLRPNDFGLFDAIGNLMEHCHNPVTRFFPNCAVCPGPISGTCELRLEAVKGGAFLFAAERLRVVDRVPRGGFDYEYMQPDMPLPFFGFRIARNDL